MSAEKKTTVSFSTAAQLGHGGSTQRALQCRTDAAVWRTHTHSVRQKKRRGKERVCVCVCVSLCVYDVNRQILSLLTLSLSLLTAYSLLTLTIHTIHSPYQNAKHQRREETERKRKRGDGGKKSPPFVVSRQKVSFGAHHGLRSFFPPVSACVRLCVYVCVCVACVCVCGCVSVRGM